VLAKLGEALPVFDKKIELLILTHPDSDHLSGLVEVLKRYEVGQILETGIFDNSAEYQEWNNLIKQKNIPVAFAQKGQIIKIADNLSIKILYPFGIIAGQNFGDNTNKTSIVGKIIYGQNEVLFTGDAEQNTEEPLLWTGADLQADILVVGHHGSKNSTGEKFLAAVAPQIAVIQVGAKNKYGHPAPETLERLKNVRNILRTDLGGDIEFLCNLVFCKQVR
jgi:competence protein ComEC